MNFVGKVGNIFSNLFDKVLVKRVGCEEDFVGIILYFVSWVGVSFLFIISFIVISWFGIVYRFMWMV